MDAGWYRNVPFNEWDMWNYGNVDGWEIFWFKMSSFSVIPSEGFVLFAHEVMH